ncbi:UDP-galactose transporter [Cystobasidium minutum MCA 4210]|uniref:UDP-galactose transporter n=1 Tax=Cystobasidium minutum MCA 4210 TaxID=1397322 RepID=UPI0034CF6A9D|eukprot:jgi/Rhomi1/146968/e_gw1.7.272.1
MKAISANKPGAGLLSVPEVPSHPALSIASYCAASILMTVVNKFVLSGHHFTMNFLLLTIQSLVCVACVVTCKRMKMITFRDFDKDDARKWFPVSFLLVLVIYTGSKALQYLSIPVYTIFKNLTIILIAYGEVLWFGGSVTPMTLASFGLMVLSSLVAAWDDIGRLMASMSSSGALIPISDADAAQSARTAAGYAWMMVNCLASAGYVLGMRKRIKVTNFKDWDSMFYNNLLSIPVLVIFSLLFEDWSAKSLELNFPAESRILLLWAMAFSGLGAVFISYSTAWCVRTTSSTTYSMVGALNKLPVAASGLIFFGDPVTFSSVTGIFTGFVAGLVYAIAKQAQSKNSKSGA